MEGALPPASFRTRETRTSSQTSERSGDESSEFVEQEETSILDSPAAKPMTTEWTDEKHSLYLKSMEASFVNQLHNSMALLGWRTQKENSSGPKTSWQRHYYARTSSGQFKVFRRGGWQKINFEIAEPQLDGADDSRVHLANEPQLDRADDSRVHLANEPQLDRVDDSRVHLANPWIRHFRSSCRNQVVTSPTLQENSASESHLRGKMPLTGGLATGSKQFPECHSHLCYQDSVDRNTEVSDQNFVDEDIKGETASSMCSAKRMKTLVAPPSSNDQVVPFGKSPVTDVTDNCVSSERERPCSSDWESENMDGLV